VAERRVPTFANKIQPNGRFCLRKSVLDVLRRMSKTTFFPSTHPNSRKALRKAALSAVFSPPALMNVYRISLLGLLRPHRDRPRDSRAAECGQQCPPSDGDCHAPLPCEGA